MVVLICKKKVEMNSVGKKVDRIRIKISLGRIPSCKLTFLFAKVVSYKLPFPI